MPRLSSALVIGAAVCLGACAVPPRAKDTQTQRNSSSKPTATVANDAGIQCRTDRPTGTLLATKICTTAEQRRAAAEHAQEVRDKIDKSVPTTCPGAPGCH